MEKKQTAVEWLEWQINLGLSERGLISAIKQAKQMEKEQIEIAFANSYLTGCEEVSYNDANKASENYYNKTYGGNNE
jgi:hypothetical protein